MRRNYLDDQPMNFGQFIGRTLSGVVAPELARSAESKRLSLADAEDRAFKNRNWLADEAYRDATLAETNRHNLAMEAPKPVAAKRYEPRDIEDAVAYLTMNPGEDPTGAIRKKLVRYHGMIKPAKEQKVVAADLPPDIINSGLKDYQQYKVNALQIGEPDLSPSQYYSTRIESGIPRLGAKWDMFNQPSVRDSIRAGFLSAAGPENIPRVTDTTGLDAELEAELKRRGLQ